MSRCIACNSILTEIECRKKDKAGNYLDMCSRCMHEVKKIDSDVELRQTVTVRDTEYADGINFDEFDSWYELDLGKMPGEDE